MGSAEPLLMAHLPLLRLRNDDLSWLDGSCRRGGLLSLLLPLNLHCSRLLSKCEIILYRLSWGHSLTHLFLRHREKTGKWGGNSSTCKHPNHS